MICGAEGELIELACRCLAANPVLRPAEEAEAWQAFWAEVEALRQKVSE